MLKFSIANDNAKLKKLAYTFGGKFYTFSIMSGHNCPFARECQAFAVPKIDGTWGIKDGKQMKFRCFSASQEILYPALREQRINNMVVLEKCAVSSNVGADYICQFLPDDASLVRVHVAGDFKTQAYFDAWIETARRRRHIHFYAYTKALTFWIARLSTIPANFVLTASYGGTRDDMIQSYGLRSARVVYSLGEAKRLGLRVDHDDSLAVRHGKDFALLIHGIGPKGSTQAMMQYAKARKGKSKQQ